MRERGKRRGDRERGERGRKAREKMKGGRGRESGKEKPPEEQKLYVL